MGTLPLPLWVGDLLPALAGESNRVLAGALGDRDTLQRDREPRSVHHGEHAREPAVLLADEPANGAIAVAKDHRACGARVDAELVLDAAAAHVVARSVRQHLRRQEKRDPASSLRRIGQPGQHEIERCCR